MPKFQISGYSLDDSPQTAASGISGDAYWLFSLSIFLIRSSFCAACFRTAVPIFVSGSPDSPQIA
jgi:hypothetical protein